MNLLLLALVITTAEPLAEDSDAADNTAAPVTAETRPTAAPHKGQEVQDCIQAQDRAGFCPDGTVWSAGPCDGGEYLVCERTAEFPNLLATSLQGLMVLGYALPPFILAVAAALLAGSLGAIIKSTDNTLTDPEATRWRTGSLALAITGALTIGAAGTVLVLGVLSTLWVWRQGLEVVETREDGGRRVTLLATHGFGHPSPLASYRSTPEKDCHSEIQRLAAEDHFFKVAEIWAKKNRSLFIPLDPWRNTPRLPDRTPASRRMTVQQCEAQLAAGATRVRKALEEAARAREELRRVEEQARQDLLDCARKQSTCTCNCSSQGGTGVGGLGGSVELGPASNAGELMARLSSALSPDIKVSQDTTGAIQVPLREVILFDVDKDTLTPAAWGILSKAANVLMANPQIHIMVEGHTSAPGSADYNQDLSNRRAKAVVQALISLGVGQGRVGIQAFGKSRPDVKTDKEEQKNRRVIIRLVHEADVQRPPGAAAQPAEPARPSY